MALSKWRAAMFLDPSARLDANPNLTKSLQGTKVNVRKWHVYDFWIWHTCFGLPRSLNDINVLDKSSFYQKIQDGTGPKVHSKAHGTDYWMAYYSLQKKLDQLPAVDIQHAPAKLPSKLHMFAYVDFLAQSLCSVHSDCASKLGWNNIGERFE